VRVFTLRNLGCYLSIVVFFFLENWVIYKSAALSITLDALLHYYPDIPSLGSPYPSPSRPSGSWDDDSRIFEPLESNQYKRASSIFGDLVFESGRRAQLDDIAQAGVPVYSYRFIQAPDADPNMGTFHSAELPYGEFGGWGADKAPLTRFVLYHCGLWPWIARMMSRAWIHFAHDLNPNGPGRELLIVVDRIMSS
jgi:hypothetical protein